MKHLVTLLCLCVGLAGCQSLSTRMTNPPNVVIYTDSDECPVYTRDINNKGNGSRVPRCEVNGVKRSDAVCRQEQEVIIWRLAGNTPFTIAFKQNDAAMKTAWQCGAGNNTYECTVPYGTKDNVYGYEVEVQGCVLDPTIFIY